jgi:hypothetical protein
MFKFTFEKKELLIDLFLTKSCATHSIDYFSIFYCERNTRNTTSAAADYFLRKTDQLVKLARLGNTYGFLARFGRTISNLESRLIKENSSPCS